MVTGKLDVREAAAQLPEEADEEEPVDEAISLADNVDDNSFNADVSEEELAIEGEVTA